MPTSKGETVAEAMRALPVEYRQALRETYYRGRTVREAARALGLPAETVKARLYHGMRALSGAIAEGGARAGAGAGAGARAGGDMCAVRASGQGAVVEVPDRPARELCPGT